MGKIHLISDLHIGGDGPLDECDFEEELIAYLEGLKNGELIIAGDAFGLWEFAELEGVEKLHAVIKSHPRIFEQFKRTGEVIAITLIPGNHDYDLACYPEYIPLLAEYGIRLEQEVAIERQVGSKRIWIEHGMQHDTFNCFERFGEPADKPVGYYVTAQFVSGAAEISSRGKQNWLKDIQAVYPTEHIPYWAFSNYFYREMSPILRYFLLPFLLLFTISCFVGIIAIAEDFGVLPTEISQLHFLNQIGGIGKLISWTIAANVTIFSFLMLLAIPGYFLFRDIMATLKRYRLISDKDLADEKGAEYEKAAQEVFQKHPDVAAFIYGHTHDVSLKKIDNRLIINTGSWLKQLNRASSISRFLPDVWLSSYRLSSFCIYEENDQIIVDYEEQPKTSTEKIAWLEWFVTLGQKRKRGKSIPKRTILPVSLEENRIILGDPK